MRRINPSSDVWNPLGGRVCFPKNVFCAPSHFCAPTFVQPSTFVPSTAEGWTCQNGRWEVHAPTADKNQYLNLMGYFQYDPIFRGMHKCIRLFSSN